MKWVGKQIKEATFVFFFFFPQLKMQELKNNALINRTLLFRSSILKFSLSYPHFTDYSIKPTLCMYKIGKYLKFVLLVWQHDLDLNFQQKYA